jgi:membrane associated rhomboid family serine protease
VIQNLLRNLPLVTKNLLIINVLMGLVAFASLITSQFDLNDILGLYYPKSDHFQPFQVVTHMFMHGSIGHIFFNMFGLVVFGSILEQMWGAKRFLFYYFMTGFGAVGLHMLVQHIEAVNIIAHYPPADMPAILEQIGTWWSQHQQSTNPELARLAQIYNGGAVGASGAINGLLVGFAVLFPNKELMLIFLPVPIKAKYFVPVLLIASVFMGVANFSWDNIAHWAHLGGALIGFIIIKWWQKKGL